MECVRSATTALLEQLFLKFAQQALSVELLLPVLQRTVSTASKATTAQVQQPSPDARRALHVL
jgi:hypothetical protein